MIEKEPAAIAEEIMIITDNPAWLAKEPALPVEDPIGAVEKLIKKLFNEAYIKDPISNDVLRQLYRGQTRSNQLSLAEYQEDSND